jgi:hypothetical protein
MRIELAETHSITFKFQFLKTQMGVDKIVSETAESQSGLHLMSSPHSMSVRETLRSLRMEK